MPDSSQGAYSRPASPIPVTGQGADAPQINVAVDDIAAALNRRAFRDGRAPLLGNQDFNGYRATGAENAVDAQDYVTLSQVQALIAALNLIPVGIVVPLTTETIPTGWLRVNGQAVSRTTYSALWTHAQASGMLAASEGVKGVGQFGPGDGSTTFTLPNLEGNAGYFVRPVSSGRTIGSAQSDAFASHNHSASFTGNPVPDHSHTSLAVSGIAGNVFGNGSSAAGTSSTSAAGGHTPTGTVTVTNAGGTETRPLNVAYLFIIKT